VLVSDHWSPWVNLTNGFTPLHDGTFLWESERSGFRHLYLYRPDGTLARVVTSGAFPLAGVDRLPSVVGVDERRGEVYVMASIHSPLEQHLYVTSYRHASPLRRVSREPGWWSARMSAAANVYVGTHSRYDTPPRTAVYAADGTLRRWLVENPLDASHPYFPYRGGLPRPEFGELRAEDGQTLHYVLMKPTAFDPRRRYPAIVQVYGGPGRQKVTSAWRSPSERLYLEAGFVVFQLDNRGSSNRGLRFEAPISRALGGAEVRDQLVGLKFLRSQSYVDGNRIGVSGWSYGGYMTLRMMTEPGADIAAGIAGAPVSLWRLYDTHYTERFLGRPQDDPGAYASASIVPRLARLQGRLLYAHGMSDDNVLLENGTAIIGALQRLGTTFDLMLYPGERHGINDPALQLHLWRTSIEFFRRTLGGPVDAPRAASEPPTP
jgi:dipeptidyl-peptidase-4